MFNLTNHLLVVALLIFCCAIQFKAQTQNSLTIEQAKNKLEQLQTEYATIDEVFNKKIEIEVSKQVSIAPKDEFESTQQYDVRLTKAETLRKKLKTQYVADRKSQQGEIRNQIDNILNLEFTKPVTINLETYDADEEVFALMIKDKSSQTSYEDFLYISRNEARLLKQGFSAAQNQGLFGVALENGQPTEYYYGFRINLKDKRYTNLPSELISAQTVPQVKKNITKLNKIIKWLTDSYGDVTPSYSCKQPVLAYDKIICANKDLQLIEKVYRMAAVYAYENATKEELNHKTLSKNWYYEISALNRLKTYQSVLDFLIERINDSGTGYSFE